MWDLVGRDSNRPLSEMIDMQAYQQRMKRSRLQAVRRQERSERRSAILGVIGVIVLLSYLVHVMVPGGFWAVAQFFIH